MSSSQVPIESDTQYDRLIAAMAELRSRSKRILADARATRDRSRDLRVMQHGGSPETRTTGAN